MGRNNKNDRLKIERINEENINTFGSKMILVDYKSNENVLIYFPEYNWYRPYTFYQHFKDGNVKCPYEKRFYNVGYIGEGNYKCKENRKQTNAYSYWHGMLKRCYCEYDLKKHPTYINCEVCEEWHNFQNFAKWYEENYYEINDEIMELDKDILLKGNKIYSPKTCIFVPHRINGLFTKADKSRGDYPIGVCYHKRDNVLEVKCSVYKNNKKKRKHLGRFSPSEPFRAFICYKNFKENYIKQVADEYKDLIPTELYEAMYKYKVEIND